MMDRSEAITIMEREYLSSISCTIGSSRIPTVGSRTCSRQFRAPRTVADADCYAACSRNAGQGD
jgi:hypothetical protein